MNISLLAELDNISSLHVLKRDDIDAILEEIGTKILECLNIDRVSVWLFNDERTGLISIGEVDKQEGQFQKGKVLRRKASPMYFQALFRDQILNIPDVQRSSVTKELNEHYNIPYSIASLIDIPLRITGETIGVICFEQKYQVRLFEEDEISFAQSVAQVCASALEARKRRAVQYELEKELREKNIILNELNHRLKNNYAILSSIIRRRTHTSEDIELHVLGRLLEERVFNLAGIQDILQRSTSEAGINCSYFFRKLQENHPEWQAWFRFEIEHSMDHISSKTAIYLGGIILELVECVKSNAFIFAENLITIQLKGFIDSYALEVSFHSSLENFIPSDKLYPHIHYIQDLCEESRISYTCDLTLPLFLKLFFKKEF